MNDPNLKAVPRLALLEVLWLFDHTCTADTRKEYPGLYHSHEFFNHRKF